VIYIKEYIRKHSGKGYPFIDLINDVARVEFSSPVTLVCGSNGSGKSTFVKILSALANCDNIAHFNANDNIADAIGNFGIVRTHSPKRRFFFSAEDFINFINDTTAKQADALAAIDEINNSDMLDYAKSQAKLPHFDTLNAISNLYGEIEHLSHGQGYNAFFDSRLRPDGFFILDEPESALSYQNQYNLAYKIYHMAKNDNCQFVISTHSPILLAIPEATILSADDCLTPVTYDDAENIGFLTMFLKNKDRLFDL
jgi:predicted ATPase